MTLLGNTRRSAATALIAGTAALAALPTQATEGYFALGYSPAQRSLGGAGVARGFEAMSTAINPAGVAGVGTQLQFGLELFSPSRGYTGTGTGFVPTGTVDSDENLFFVPNFAYNRALQNGAVLNFAMYGNGGMNTTYRTGLAGCGSVFCGGQAGVDLMQMFLSATYAKKVGAFSFGISPTVAVQRFEATGLGAFAALSADPANLTDNSYDMSYGFGVRAGIEVELSPTLRFGVAGQTKMDMSEFSNYAGLFADGGDFDIPASVTVGLAWQAQPGLTLMADYQKIFYSDIPSIANPFGAGLLGSAGGPGFGWEDVDVFKIAAEWRQNDTMTWRAGYTYSTNPVGSDDVTLNILAPGIVQHHISAGGTWTMNQRDSLDFSVGYVLPSTVSGLEVTPLGATPGSNIELNMHQLSASVGWTRRF
ncbi:MAG: hydrocarbon degradation protein [Rhodobacteraceae bacterium]|nr:hydrocarbon degradation protein [Paracoccaceae bacterium]